MVFLLVVVVVGFVIVGGKSFVFFLELYLVFIVINIIGMFGYLFMLWFCMYRNVFNNNN